jgi:hypothetical protein
MLTTDEVSRHGLASGSGEDETAARVGMVAGEEEEEAYLKGVRGG